MRPSRPIALETPIAEAPLPPCAGVVVLLPELELELEPELLEPLLLPLLLPLLPEPLGTIVCALAAADL